MKNDKNIFENCIKKLTNSIQIKNDKN